MMTINMGYFSKNICISALICIGLVYSTNAQELKLKEEKAINLSHEKIFNAFVDTVNGKLLLFFFGEEVKKSGDIQNEDSTITYAGIYDDQNNRIMLQAIEYPVKYCFDTLITIENPIGGGSVIRKYLVQNATVKMFFTRKDNLITLFKPMKNGMYLGTDINDASTGTTALFDPNFKKVREIESIFESYEQHEFADNGNEILIVNSDEVCQDPNQGTELLRVNASTGTILNKYYFPKDNIDINGAFFGHNCMYVSYVIDVSHQYFVRSLRLDGSTIWDKQQLIGPGRWGEILDKNLVIFADNTGVKAFDLHEGSLQWYQSNKQLMDNMTRLLTKDLQKKAKHKATKEIERVKHYVDLYPNQGFSGFAVLIHLKPSPVKELVKNEYLGILNADGQVVALTEINEEESYSKLFNVKGELWVLNDKKLRKYEIKNINSM
jgi:hypothetical protein